MPKSPTLTLHLCLLALLTSPSFLRPHTHTGPRSNWFLPLSGQVFLGFILDLGTSRKSTSGGLFVGRAGVLLDSVYL